MRTSMMRKERWNVMYLTVDGVTRLVHEEISIDDLGIFMRSSLESESVNKYQKKVRILVEIFIEKQDGPPHKLTLIDYCANEFTGNNPAVLEKYQHAKDTASAILLKLASIVPFENQYNQVPTFIDKTFFSPLYMPQSKRTEPLSFDSLHEQDASSDESFIPEFLENEVCFIVHPKEGIDKNV